MQLKGLINKERLAGDRFREITVFIAYFLACVGETQTKISQNLSSARRSLYRIPPIIYEGTRRGMRVSLPTYAVPGIAIVVAATANAILAFGTPLLFGVFPDRRQEGYCDTVTLGAH